MKALTLIAALLAQTDEAPAPATEAPVEPPAAAIVKSGAGPVAAPAIPADAQKLLSKINSKDDKERSEALSELQQKYGSAAVNPIAPPLDLDVEVYAKMPEADQARLMARRFIDDLISADVNRLVAASGLPFMMEDRRIDRPEDLRGEWARQLRGKRTDLLVTYDVEILQAAEMEKKYGRPPARLNAWNWRAPRTLIAVVNLSGHGTVLLMRQVGLAFQVVGMHD